MRPRRISDDLKNVETDRNEFRVIRLVRDHDAISRVEIAQLLGLSKATVTWIVGGLLERGYLEFVGAGSSSVRGGRKRQLLRFNPRSRFVMGVDIKLREAHVALADLNAEILDRRSIRYEPGSPSEEVLDGIRKVLIEWRRSRPDAYAKTVGIGIGLPGVIDEDKGAVRVVDAMSSWRDVNIKRYFEDETGLQAFVENDVKTMTVGEYLFGAGRHVPDHVLLFVGDGIGAGIVLGGRLHRGITSSAGEVGFNALGHSVSDPSKFSSLVFGQKDFGDTVSDVRFIAAYHRIGGTKAIATTEELIQLADEGDQHAARVIEEAAGLISILCIDLINALNPELIILAGRIAQSDTFLRLIQDRVREDILSVPAEAVHIVRSKLGVDGVLRGAVGLVLYELFKPARTARNRPFDSFPLLTALK